MGVDRGAKDYSQQQKEIVKEMSDKDKALNDAIDRMARKVR